MRKRRFAAVYLGLLALSWTVRLLPSAPPVMPADVTVQTLADATFVASREYGDPDSADVVVLLHGSPMAGESLLAQAEALADDAPAYRILVPDLPGFGLSQQPLGDYSIVAHAAFVNSWLDALGVVDAHVVGYSLGGGVALEMFATRPDRLRSLTLLASIGVQELELLGDYRANHAVHGIQLALISAVDWFVPHFGAFDDALLNRAYARNFYDSDQRPLRALIGRFDAPLLIVHGESDSLVPYAAAVEHARIAPHAQLVTLVGGHGLPFRQPAAVAAELAAFLTAVDAGIAPSRHTASAERQVAAALPFDRERLPSMGGVSSLLIGLGVIVFSYISEDLATIAAGLAASAGALSFVEAVVYAFIGIYSGDMLVYLSGRLSRRGRGVAALTRRPRVLRAAQWFERRGTAALLLARFVPGTRFPTFFAAGVLGMPFIRFSILLIAPALVWTPALVWLAAESGEAVLGWLASYQRWALPALLVAGLALWLGMQLLALVMNPAARRLAVGRWQRLTRWEYWPSFVIYGPLIPYFVWLGFRHRSMLAFTAVNPGMPLSGFVGESKAAILSSLPAAVVPAWRLLPAGASATRLAAFREFFKTESLAYPVVLKPDAGERGRGVLIAHSDAAVADYLAAQSGPLIVQAFAAGIEYGVFYYRYPDQREGRLFAVTTKEPLVVTGDGQATLEQLILRDARAIAMAETHFAKHAARLHHVPAAGECVTLVEIGTHSMGCVFRDGSALATPALTAAIDDISRSVNGFYFGRYDVKVPDQAALERGDSIAVIELNGVTSEATSIYDPDYGIINAWRTLAQQWRLAFEIGALNRAAGAPVASPWDLIRAWWQARAT